MRRIVLKLTPLQAKGLLAMAGEGAEGLLTDPAAASAYIGDKRHISAAEEALELLKRAVGTIHDGQG